MVPTNAIQIAAEFRDRLEREIGERVRKVRVFGSYARGTARPDSDLDVLVLVDYRDRHTRRQISDIAYEVSARHDFRPDISPVVLGETQFANLAALERRIALDILDEGVDV